MNDDLIGKFRETVNGNVSLVYKTYSNVAGNNQWNLICSCMDWITLVARYQMVAPTWSNDINIKAVQVYTLISNTGIVADAIKQLHRVFFKTTDEPFRGERRFFQSSPSNQDDNRYFSQLRATFGAHPVQLDDDNGKWFASWPYDHYLEQNFDIQVRLYSREVGKDDITFGLNLSELMGFLESRYNHLEELIKEIERQYEEFCRRFANIPINTKISTSDEVRQLREESKIRLDSNYYNDILDEIILLLETSIGESEFQAEENAYKTRLVILAEEIGSNLQAMIFKNLELEKYIDPPYPFDELGYAIAKLYTYDFDRFREPLFDAHLRSLNDHCRGKYRFSSIDSPNVIRLKLKLMLAETLGST